jgi:hypothetical protein
VRTVRTHIYSLLTYLAGVGLVLTSTWNKDLQHTAITSWIRPSRAGEARFGYFRPPSNVQSWAVSGLTAFETEAWKAAVRSVWIPDDLFRAGSEVWPNPTFTPQSSARTSPAHGRPVIPALHHLTGKRPSNRGASRAAGVRSLTRRQKGGLLTREFLTNSIEPKPGHPSRSRASK